MLTGNDLKLMLKGSEYIDKPNKIKALIWRCIKESGLTQVNQVSSIYNDALTYLVSLEESYLALHSWTEYNLIVIDISICNYTRNNLDKLLKLGELILYYFQPEEVKFRLDSLIPEKNSNEL